MIIQQKLNHKDTKDTKECDYFFVYFVSLWLKKLGELNYF
jgi:hypothetical protein